MLYMFQIVEQKRKTLKNVFFLNSINSAKPSLPHSSIPSKQN